MNEAPGREAARGYGDVCTVCKGVFERGKEIFLIEICYLGFRFLKLFPHVWGS